MKLSSKVSSLENVYASILANNVCSQLRDGATQLVPGNGNANATLVFVGEAPGKAEDILGKPFMGASGKFLNEMLGSIGLNRDDIYITNIVKYRPPNNRDPKPTERQEFLPYLLQEIQIIQPKLIVLLGRHAMNALLPGLTISQVHGQVQTTDGQKYLPLYHPAAALYNGALRKSLMADFAKIPKFLQQISN